MDEIPSSSSSAPASVTPPQSPIAAPTQVPPNILAHPDLPAGWRDALARVIATGASHAGQARKQLLYTLVAPPATDPARARLRLFTAHLKVSGGFSRIEPYTTDLLRALTHPPTHLTSEDWTLLGDLHLAHLRHPGGESGAFDLQGQRGSALLLRLAHANRLTYAPTPGSAQMANTDATPSTPVNSPFAQAAQAVRALQSPLMPLKRGGERHGEAAWQMLDDGRQYFSVAVEGATHVLACDPPLYVDTVSGEIGLVQVDMDGELAATLLNAGFVQADEISALTDVLSALPATYALPKPRRLDRRSVQAEPVIHLRFGGPSGHGGAPGSDWRFKTDAAFAYNPADHPLDEEPTHTLATVWFDYDGVRRAPGSQINTRRVDQTLLTITPNMLRERSVLHELQEVGFQRFDEEGAVIADEFTVEWPADTAVRYLLDDDRIVDVMQDHLPRWRKAGWQIDFAPEFAWQLRDSDGWYAEVDADSNNAWFSIELGIEIDGRRVPLLPILSQAMSNRSLRVYHSGKSDDAVSDGAVVVRVDAHTLIRVPAERVRTVLAALVELYDGIGIDGPALRLSRTDAARLALLDNASAPWAWRGDARMRELGAKLNGFTGIQAVEMPRGLKAQLRGYQQEGLSWLQFLREYDFAGILADDMGLGKTVQTLAHILIEKESGRLDRPALIIAPTSLVPNWQAETARFAPELSVLVLHGLERKNAFSEIDKHDVVITTYPLLARDGPELKTHQFHLMILDEAQNIKNAKSRAAHIVAGLQARHRVALTGTPLENNLGELWAQFNVLLPGFLGNVRDFTRRYRTPIEKHGDGLRRDHLARRVRPFLLRRTKEQVAAELPPKTEVIRPIELSGAQRDLYETVRLAMESRVQEAIRGQGLSRSHIVVLDALLKLRQVCCDPRLVKLPAARKVQESAKLELLDSLLPQLVAEGRRILLFSQFTSMLALIEPRLTALGLDYVILTGDTQDRATPVKRFQQCEVPVFLISLKAGGVGLNLTAADTVIHYDPWWNPAVERQATDRAHRIGQDKPVFVYKLIAAGTVEEKIVALQSRKADLARGILENDATASTKLTADDLQALFAPIDDADEPGATAQLTVTPPSP